MEQLIVIAKSVDGQEDKYLCETWEDARAMYWSAYVDPDIINMRMVLYDDQKMVTRNINGPSLYGQSSKWLEEGAYDQYMGNIVIIYQPRPQYIVVEVAENWRDIESIFLYLSLNGLTPTLYSWFTPTNSYRDAACFTPFGVTRR